MWDHFYGATGTPTTPRVWKPSRCTLRSRAPPARCASGRWSTAIGYRHPAVLAKAITTIDQLSGGRADMGIGAGWAQVEYDAYGIPFPEVKTRMDQLEEGIQCLRGLLHDDVTNFAGRALHAHRGAQRTTAGAGQAADLDRRRRREAHAEDRRQYADGWNVPFIAPDAFAHKNAVLDEHCAAPAATRTRSSGPSTCGLAYTEESLQQQFGAISEFVRPGVLTGSDDEIMDTHRASTSTPGADQVNIALARPVRPRPRSTLQRHARPGSSVSAVNHARARTRTRQPDRRSHRLHRRARVPDGHRSLDRDPLAPHDASSSPLRRRGRTGVDLPLRVDDPHHRLPGMGQVRRRRGVGDGADAGASAAV
jgi:alkanesulfonate monooxygenase SsuD/methylene tetrahydromethanopterin reductase-like flavin-dependent oxidoreductase (luciferase family)